MDIKVLILTTFYRSTRFKRKKFAYSGTEYGIRDIKEDLFFCN